MNKLKYIVKDISITIGRDLKEGYNSMDKPRRIMNMLFYIGLIHIFTQNYHFLILTTILYFVAYIWLIIKKGDWRHRMREDYKRRLQ